MQKRRLNEVRFAKFQRSNNKKAAHRAAFLLGFACSGSLSHSCVYILYIVVLF